MTIKQARVAYTATIGIECHVQLKTVTKLFAGVSNDARDAAPNTLVSPLCFGLPGTLSVLNEAAIELASKAAFALNTTPQPFSKFDRKHYFYPDLPKGYQITQFDEPIIADGHVDIIVDGQPKRVGITRAHLEEDAGKNTHPAGTDYSLVDLNRAGTPLLEIVSEPDMHTAQEAKAYVRELYLLMRYADVSDADLFHGNMRFDVNVSVSKDRTVLGTRTETKNLNSFRAVEKAIDHEIDRQTGLLERGEQIVQETRGWDDSKQKTLSQRGKEESHDYRYMPEPDIPPIMLDHTYTDRIKAAMPPLPGEWRARLDDLGLDERYTDTLLEAEIEDEQYSYLGLLETHLKDPALVRALANWFVNIEIPLRRDGDAATHMNNADRERLYIEAHKLLSSNILGSTSAKSLLRELLKTGVMPQQFAKYAEEQGYTQESDEAVIESIVSDVIAQNKQAAQDIRDGETKAIGYLVGQVMKQSQGKANPELAQKIIKKLLA